ncbi:MAG: hypothetical protein ACRD52_19235 [Candidatus Acidiferrales bacterium]
MKSLAQIAPVLTAAVLAILLIWDARFMTKGLYRLMFFFGLAALAIIIMRPGSSSFFYLPSSTYIKFMAVSFFVFVAITPFALLIEIGFSGYRGFASWMRYVAVSLVFLGGFGLIASLLIPRLLRR